MQLKFFHRVSVKLILVLSSLILLNLSVYTFYTISQLKSDLTASSRQNAYNLSDIIKKSTRHGMLHNRREDIYHIIKTIGTEEGVEKIRIYNKEGIISYSSDSSEINKIVNLDDQACIKCHSLPTPPANLSNEDRIRFFNIKDQKVLGLINPIINEKDCYTSDCHAHDKNKKILGVLDVVLSTQRMESIIETNTQTIIVNAIVLTILISVLVIAFVNILINQPLKRIAKGIDQLAQGHLDYRLKINSNDELGYVAKEFNEMGGKLNDAYQEIKEWSETLNLKVQEKNEELKKIYEQITQIEKLASLGTLSATVAHELNNPLEGILTYSKLIAKKLAKDGTANPENEKIIKFLLLISDESARCGKIVKDLLLFSRQGESEFKLNTLNHLVEKSLIIINHHLEINRINLYLNLCPKDPKIYCDGQKIEQALIAILMNGIEAMPDGGNLDVSIKCRETEKEVDIRIADQGKGIADKDLPHIFEPFFSTKGGNKGTGLGLAVAYGIIVQHKGNILVEKTSLSGTTFKISLPLTLKSEELNYEQKSEHSYS